MWQKQGYIEATTGNVVDYSFVRARINELAEDFDIQEIAYDPWNATQLAIELGEQDGFEVIKFRQGFKTMSEPSKELERLVLCAKLAHGSNPVIRWMIGNVAVATDPAGNIKFNKEKSREKIDGVITMVMSMARAQYGQAFKKESKYEETGLTEL
jgi:phage terminase large subunit-like protein